MHFVALLIAGLGVLLLVYLSSVSTASKPRLNRAEPLLVILSLVAIFWALQSTVSDGAQSPMRNHSHSMLHDLFFENHCASHLGGTVRLAGSIVYCIRDDFATDQTQRPSDVPH
ncbi:MAG: hypothetical protein JXR15_14805 [Shimia sp.]|uniref:hypothetical protein n=1 Tax=Shimia sp. TaxID=1954381 RepID=UPI003B8BDDFD